MGLKESTFNRSSVSIDIIVKTKRTYAGCPDCAVFAGPGYAPLVRMATPLLD
jgi:hypothetical protein